MLETRNNVHFYSLKIDDDALFKNMSKRPAFVLRPLKSMLNFEVDRLSIQQLEYEMDCTDYPANYIFFNKQYNHCDPFHTQVAGEIICLLQT